VADRGYLQRRGSVVGQNENSECVSSAVRTHGWLQCWYCGAYTWLAAVLVLLCVHMAGCSASAEDGGRSHCLSLHYMQYIQQLHCTIQHCTNMCLTSNSRNRDTVMPREKGELRCSGSLRDD
jgi:hypothetical protein